MITATSTEAHFGLQQSQDHTGKTCNRAHTDIDSRCNNDKCFCDSQYTNDRTLFQQICQVVFRREVICTHNRNNKQHNNNGNQRKLRCIVKMLDSIR